MKQISARQFRLTFGELEEPVQVTLYKDGEYRAIGTYTPIMTAVDARATEAIRPGEPPSVMGGQAGRDAILRKINKSGSER